MREFLKGEVTQIVPQALVQVTERLEPELDNSTGPQAMDVTVSPFDLLYGASADPQVARELGLAALDIDDPGGIYDYAVEAGFATLWAQWVLQPRIARERADRLRAELAGRPAEWKDRREFAPFSIASLITGLEQADAVSIEAPADLRVDVVPDATRQPGPGPGPRALGAWRGHPVRGAGPRAHAARVCARIGRRRRAAAPSRRREQAAGAPSSDPLWRA